MTITSALLLIAHLAHQSAAPPDSSKYNQAIRDSRSFVSDTMRVLGIPAVSVCAARADSIVWSEAFGWADLEGRVPATRETLFRVGSVSKPLTSAGLALLVERGQIDLNAPVQQYVPMFPRKRWPVTVSDLASHQAGVRHYRDVEFSAARRLSIREGLGIFADDSLEFRPHTRFLYSSFGYNLLGAAMESAAKKPFDDFMQASVFAPVGMTHTVPDYPERLVPQRAQAYVHPDASSRVVKAPLVDNVYKLPSGGYLSNADDLCRFGQALLAGTLLKKPAVEKLWTRQTTADGKRTAYGVGWYIVEDGKRNRIAFHTGDAVGSSALLAVYVDQQLVLALLMNSDRSFVEAAGRIPQRFLSQEP